MAFKTTALTSDRVRETGGHGDIDDAVAVLKPGFPNRTKPWRAEGTARPPQASTVDCAGDVGALIEPPQFVRDGWVQRWREFLTKHCLVGINDLWLDTCRDEQ